MDETLSIIQLRIAILEVLYRMLPKETSIESLDKILNAMTFKIYEVIPAEKIKE